MFNHTHSYSFSTNLNDTNTSPVLVRLTGSCSGSESHILSCPTETEDLLGFVEAKSSSPYCRKGLDEVAIQCGKNSTIENSLIKRGQPHGTPLLHHPLFLSLSNEDTSAVYSGTPPFQHTEMRTPLYTVELLHSNTLK